MKWKSFIARLPFVEFTFFYVLAASSEKMNIKCSFGSFVCAVALSSELARLAYIICAYKKAEKKAKKKKCRNCKSLVGINRRSEKCEELESGARARALCKSKVDCKRTMCCSVCKPCKKRCTKILLLHSLAQSFSFAMQWNWLDLADERFNSIGGKCMSSKHWLDGSQVSWSSPADENETLLARLQAYNSHTCTTFVVNMWIL